MVADQTCNESGETGADFKNHFRYYTGKARNLVRVGKVKNDKKFVE
ncbi:MAG: hypothetical protein ALAOOOJD_00648 [bacterium]|nr:hypothetical protein [bacterium]